MCGQHQAVGRTGVGTGAGVGVLGVASSAQRAAVSREVLYRFRLERYGGYQETR